MKLNEHKLKRQSLSLFKYNKIPLSFDKQRCGILEACTGFGKTYVGIMKIMEINKVSPESITNVVVPRTNLKDDWIKEGGHIQTHNLQNVNVFVVNSYVSYVNTAPDYLICDFLLLDECHRYAREESEFFSKVVDITSFKESMALTATLNHDERRFLTQKGYAVFDRIEEEEAEREGWIPPSVIFNLEITLNEDEQKIYEEIENRLNYYFAFFEHNFTLAQACRGRRQEEFTIPEFASRTAERKTAEQWTWWWAQELGWKGEENSEFHPKIISENARLFGMAMDERKRFLYNAPSKVQLCKEIDEAFPTKKIMFFSESSSFASQLGKVVDSCKPYHTNVSSEVRTKEGVVVAHGEVVKTGKSSKTYYRGVKSGKLRTWEQIKDVLPTAVKVSAKSVLEENKNLFESGKIKSLSTVKKLDEGLNVETIDLVVMASYTTSSRQLIQRKGRASRVDVTNVNKRAIVIVLYIKGTQEERAWIKKAQSQTKKTIKVTNVAQILTTLDNLVLVSNEPKSLYDNSAI